MKLVHISYLDTTGDEDSLMWITTFMNKYPTDKGYRIETFISPKFVRVTVYKVGLSLKGE